MNNSQHTPHTGDNFGKRGIELAGIIVDPSIQKLQVGLDIVQEVIKQENPENMTTYTRNPGVLRILGNISGRHDVLSHENPDKVAEQLAYASVHNGLVYHTDRYAPDGLYGSFDPADRKYNGVVLKERAILLQNPNHALAVLVELPGARNE